MPIAIPATQNIVAEVASIASTVAPMSPTNEIAIVRLPPILSSRKPSETAPTTAATLITMPNSSTCWRLKPNVLAA